MNADRFKFRVWDNIAKKYDTMKTLYLEQEGGVCLPDMDYIGGMTFPPEGSEFIVEQCTGIKDKNGKLIYAGDRIKSPSGAIGTVIWTSWNYAGGWLVKCKGKEPPRLFDSMWEIIGNIHEVKE